jgi:hypothetical protein
MWFKDLATQHPFYAILAVVGFTVFLFFPLVLLVIVVIGWLYHRFSDNNDSIAHKVPANLLSEPHVVERVTPYMSHNAKVAYLQSPQWKMKAAQVKTRDGYKCIVTGITTQLEVHHITYARLGDEDLSDLVTITRKVHQKIHDKLGYSRDTLYPVSAYFS